MRGLQMPTCRPNGQDFSMGRGVMAQEYFVGRDGDGFSVMYHYCAKWAAVSVLDSLTSFLGRSRQMAGSNLSGVVHSLQERFRLV